MAVAFSTDGFKTLKTIVQTPGTSTTCVIEKFSLEQCTIWIVENDLVKVALQIPDEFQQYAAKIVKWLETHTESQCFILADTSYGSCCVDEVGAEHCQADGIIHFGHSCLSATKRLPVLLVFDMADIDVEHCCQQFLDLFPSREEHIILVYQVSYYYVIAELQKKLEENYPNLQISNLHLTQNCSIASNHQSFIHQTKSVIKSTFENIHETQTMNKNDNNTGDIEKTNTLTGNNVIQDKDSETGYIYCCGRFVNIANTELEKHKIFYIGEENLTLSNLMMLWHACEFYSYNPCTRICRTEGLNTNKLLMRRFYLVEKAKDAQIVGIVVGTLGVANYLQVIERMKLLLKKSGKKHYTFVVGKLNVAKLANFMEIDIFVLVACHENSLLDSSEFYKPIITPYELELACNPDRQWTGGIVTDFQQLLPGGQSHVSLPEGDIEEQVDVSLVTGGVRKMGVSKSVTLDNDSSTALIAKENNTQLTLHGARNAGEFLSQRTWKGLEPELGKTDVKKAVEGRKGIAIGYEEEPELKQ